MIPPDEIARLVERLRVLLGHADEARVEAAKYLPGERKVFYSDEASRAERLAIIQVRKLLPALEALSPPAPGEGFVHHKQIATDVASETNDYVLVPIAELQDFADVISNLIGELSDPGSGAMAAQYRIGRILQDARIAAARPQPQAAETVEHELDCLRRQHEQRAYPCSPHCSGYLRELHLRAKMDTHQRDAVDRMREALEQIAGWCCPLLCQNCAANRETARSALTVEQQVVALTQWALKQPAEGEYAYEVLKLSHEMTHDAATEMGYPSATEALEHVSQLREALAAVHAAMLKGGDGAVGDFGWSITKLNKARPLIRAALSTLAEGEGCHG